MSHTVSWAIGAAAFRRRVATSLRFSEHVYLELDVPTLEDVQVGLWPTIGRNVIETIGTGAPRAAT